MSRKMILIAGLLPVLLAGFGLQAQQHEMPAPADDPRLEFLKGLEGVWLGSFDGQPGDQRYEFRVTAGGHAVEEREMIGTPMEMLTVYHLNAGELLGNHYCVMGNRPQVKAAPKLVDNTLTFRCNGVPDGAASHDEHHVHGWEMRLDEQGRLHSVAQLMEQGTVTGTGATVLTRSGS